MTTVTPLKLTEAELDLIEWLMNRENLRSRSEVMRFALVYFGNQLSAPIDLMRRVRLARRDSPPRASKTVARRRRLGAVAPRSAAGNT